MHHSHPKSATDLFENIIEEFLKTFAQNIRFTVPSLLILAVYKYIRRVERRFLLLAARIRAGKTYKPRRSPTPAATPRTPKPLEPPRPGDHILPRLPRGRAWMVRLIPYKAVTLGAAIEYLMNNNPEMKALISAHPSMGRILRPLLRATAATPPPELPPDRPRLTVRPANRPASRKRRIPAHRAGKIVSKSKKS